MLENKFKTQLCKEIDSRFPGSMTVHLDPTERQGIPDLLVLFPNGRWAALEGKKNASASHRPNQNYYVEKMNDMGFARFIFPENKDVILDEISREVAQ
nr:MAG TPA: hydrolase [Caudoviricetes sp.]